jgi:hypothetical protein
MGLLSLFSDYDEEGMSPTPEAERDGSGKIPREIRGLYHTAGCDQCLGWVISPRQATTPATP